MENNKNKIESLNDLKRRLSALAATGLVTASLVKVSNTNAFADYSDSYANNTPIYSTVDGEKLYSDIIREFIHMNSILAENGVNVSYQEVLGFEVTPSIASNITDILNGKFRGNEDDMKKALFTIDYIISSNMRMYEEHQDLYAIDLSKYVKDVENSQYISDAFNKVSDVMKLINNEPLNGYIIDVPGYDPCDPEDAKYINDHFTSLSTSFKVVLDRLLAWEYSLVNDYHKFISNDGATLVAFEIMQQINNVIPQDSYYISNECDRYYLNVYESNDAIYYRDGDQIYTCVNGEPHYYDISFADSLHNIGIAGKINDKVNELKTKIAGNKYAELYQYSEQAKLVFDEKGNLILIGAAGLGLGLGAGLLLRRKSKKQGSVDSLVVEQEPTEYKAKHLK